MTKQRQKLPGRCSASIYATPWLHSCKTPGVSSSTLHVTHVLYIEKMQLGYLRYSISVGIYDVPHISRLAHPNDSPDMRQPTLLDCTVSPADLMTRRTVSPRPISIYSRSRGRAALCNRPRVTTIIAQRSIFFLLAVGR